MPTSLDGGEGGHGMIPTGGLGPPPPFSYFWKCQSTSFLRQLETYCLLYQLRLGRHHHGIGLRMTMETEK